MSYPQVLTIAGSDSGGGAGIQADLKVMQMRKVFGMSIITAITAQNTLGVRAIRYLDKEIICEQFAAIFDDFAPKSAKIGMLGNAEIIKIVAENLKKYNPPNLVLDPVMVAKGGAKLLKDEAIELLKSEILPLSSIITPNIPEAEVLTGISIKNAEILPEVAEKLRALGAKNIIIKGGHLEGENSRDYVFLSNGDSFYLDSPRFNTPHTHGTGCSFSACLAAELAKGKDLRKAIELTKQFISLSIKTPLGIGKGKGPINYWAGNSEI